MSKKGITATQRLKQDYFHIVKDPVPNIIAHPLPSNILEWHFIVRGLEDTPYDGGLYHGKLIFPSEFPFKPPSIYMITPNGRFKCNTRLCLSMSDYHPETWNPLWSVSTILTGLLSFMVERKRTTGAILTSDKTKRLLAKQSLEFNLKDPIVHELFPDFVEEIKEILQERAELQADNNPTNQEEDDQQDNDDLKGESEPQADNNTDNQEEDDQQDHDDLKGESEHQAVNSTNKQEEDDQPDLDDLKGE